MPTAAPTVRIVIVNYNSGHLLAETIKGLTGQSYGNFEAVIVDNASSDQSLQYDILPDRRFQLIRLDKNIGFAAACNLGANGATTPWLAMLNPDAVPEPEWLAEIVQAQSRHPLAAMFGSTQINAASPHLLDGAGDNYSIFGIAWRGGFGQSVQLVQNDFRALSPCAAAAFYRRDIFESVDGFAESFFCYLEDVDLGLRINLLGHHCIQVAKARVHHLGSAITGRHSKFTLFHSTRNGIWLILRCMPIPLVLVMLPLYCAAQLWLGIRTDSLAIRTNGLWHGLKHSKDSLVKRRTVNTNISSTRTIRLISLLPIRIINRHIVEIR